MNNIAMGNTPNPFGRSLVKLRQKAWGTSLEYQSGILATKIKILLNFVTFLATIKHQKSPSLPFRSPIPLLFIPLNHVPKPLEHPRSR